MMLLTSSCRVDAWSHEEATRVGRLKMIRCTPTILYDIHACLRKPVCAFPRRSVYANCLWCASFQWGVSAIRSKVASRTPPSIVTESLEYYLGTSMSTLTSSPSRATTVCLQSMFDSISSFTYSTFAKLCLPSANIVSCVVRL